MSIRRSSPASARFLLRPVEEGAAEGVVPIRAFLEEVLEHIALQVTQHERGRYWLKEVYSPLLVERVGAKAPVARFLKVPPADTMVLLGFVHNQRHWNWIQEAKRYNLRAYGERGFVGIDSKKLACDVAVLSCPSVGTTAIARIIGQPEIVTGANATPLGYPGPRGHYFCLSLEFIEDEPWMHLVTPDVVEQLRSERSSQKGAPVALSWLELTKLL